MASWKLIIEIDRQFLKGKIFLKGTRNRVNPEFAWFQFIVVSNCSVLTVLSKKALV